MRKSLSKFAQSVGIGFALALTFSCSSDDADNSGSKIPSSSSKTISSSSFVVLLSSNTEQSSSSSVYSSSSNAASSSSGTSECESIFNPSTSFCYGGEVYSKCNGMEYNPTTHICQGILANPAKCNGTPYNPLEQACCASSVFSLASQRCQNNVVETQCGANWYNSENAALRCQNNVVETQCGINWYNITTQFCYNTTIYGKCGDSDYNPLTHFCYNNSKIGEFCGNNPQRYYNPDLYECKANINPNGIYLKVGLKDTRDGRTYNAVLIGSQTWMAENLNYNASGSKYYSTYGRLYDWSTAMNFSQYCNNNICANQINSMHKGICPSGWHIPSKDEWNVLMQTVDPSCYSSDVYNCPNFGIRLKASNGWSYNGKSGNGTDDYGFSALPGGMYIDDDPDMISLTLGRSGHWFSAGEYDNRNAYEWRISTFDGEWTSGRPSHYWKYVFESVRCVQD